MLARSEATRGVLRLPPKGDGTGRQAKAVRPGTDHDEVGSSGNENGDRTPSGGVHRDCRSLCRGIRRTLGVECGRGELHVDTLRYDDERSWPIYLVVPI